MGFSRKKIDSPGDHAHTRTVLYWFEPREIQSESDKVSINTHLPCVRFSPFPAPLL